MNKNQILNQNAENAAGTNPYFFTLSDERGKPVFVMKSELEVTTKRLAQKEKGWLKNKGNLSLILSQPLNVRL